MKTSYMVPLFLALAMSGSTPQAAESSRYASQPVVVERGPDHNLWQYETREPGPHGKTVTRIHQYHELAAGLNYQDSAGKWTPAQEKIEAFAGGAVARYGQHKVIFANNLNTAGAIDMQAADGQRLSSHILGLMYVDSSTGQSVLIARLQDSEGQLVGANQVIYRDAFSGVKADVRYTYRREGIEQDVILRQQPPAPETYGLSSKTVDLEVFTEFMDPPAAQIAEETAGGAEDQAVSWGRTSLGQSKAFSLGGEAVETPVTKRYIEVGGRYFLLEKVRLQAIQPALGKLPEQASNAKRLPGLASAHFTFPKAPVAKSAARPMRLAMGELPDKGYVLDYSTISGTITNFTFQGDSTYYISGSLFLYGTVVFEGGTVIKNATTGSTRVMPAGTVTFNSGAYRPVVFTAVDDNTVGESISGSTGTPSGYYGSYLRLLCPTAQVTDARFSYGSFGLIMGGNTVGSVQNVQFVNCNDGLDALTNIVVNNGLFANVGVAFFGVSATVGAEHCTFANVSLVAPAFMSIHLTNCVLANLTNQEYNLSGANNGFYNTPEFGANAITNTTYPFQTVGGGSFYLATNSVFHNAGATNVDPAVLADLAQRTTYPPVVYSNVTLSVATTLGPQAPRDNAGVPDLGYHYDPLDYVFGASCVATNLTFTAGTAVGHFFGGYSDALELNDNVTASFNGTVSAPCCWAKYSTVQEGNGNWVGGSSGGALVSEAATTLASVQSFFTKCYGLADEENFFDSDRGFLVERLNASEFYSGCIGAYSASLNLTNCLIVNAQVGLWQNYGSANLTMENCTMIRGYLFADNTSGGAWPVTIVNSAFDNTLFYMNAHGGITNGYYTDYNAFLLNTNFNASLASTNRTVYPGGHEVIVTNSYNWQTSWLGNYYLPANSPLVNAGSTTADKVGLYHFTTQTSQVKETNSVVDIGYHYVATDGYGNPVDTNGDGIPDYVDDANGDGLVDNGEMGWNVVGSSFQVIISRPRNGSVLP